ncbi:MAG: hypothetical protein QNK04_05890 [Myxococcota bacterium]|nr:hypothetical protein [Myxococcota bacterium]
MARVCLALLVLLCAVTISQADRAMKVYRAEHRAAAELMDGVEVALGEGGSAALDGGTNSIVLSGSSEALKRALAFLEQQDRARRGVMVEAELTTLSGLDAAGYRIEWEAGTARLKIGSRRLDDPRREVNAGRRLRSRRDNEQRSALRILEGDVGRIQFSLSVPVRSRGLVGTTVFIGADAGLLARPVLLGDGRVQLGLEVFDGRVDLGGRREGFEADTTVVLEPGETVVVGALDRRGASRRSRVFATTKGRTARDEAVVLLRAEVEPDPS